MQGAHCVCDNRVAALARPPRDRAVCLLLSLLSLFVGIVVGDLVLGVCSSCELTRSDANLYHAPSRTLSPQNLIATFEVY